MIKSYKDRETRKLSEDGRCPGKWRAIRKSAEIKLDMLNAAVHLVDLCSPPGNRLEALKGTAKAGIASGSMIIGVSVSAGPTRDLKTSRSSVTIKRRVMPRIRSHPGEVLKQEFLVPLNMSARALADAIFVPANRLTDILRGKRDVSADTALRLGRYFGTTAQFWMNLQAAHDLSRAEAESNYIEIQPRNRGCVT